MAQTVELEGAPSAIEAGTAVSLEAATSTLVSAAGSRRKTLHCFNNSEEAIWLRYAADGNEGSGTAIPIPSNTGLVVRNYFGALCAWSEKANELHVAEF